MIAVIGLYAILCVSLTYLVDTLPSSGPPLPHVKRQVCLSLVVSVAAALAIYHLLI